MYVHRFYDPEIPRLGYYEILWDYKTYFETMETRSQEKTWPDKTFNPHESKVSIQELSQHLAKKVRERNKRPTFSEQMPIL